MAAGSSPIPAATAAAIHHVFIIVLENKNFDNAFGTSRQDPYLQKVLVPMGGLLTRYYGTGHVSLDNYIAMISGQSSTPDTASDCISGLASSTGKYEDVRETGIAAYGQVIAASGCVYPAHVKTLPDQLQAAELSWKGYMEDMGNDPARESATCAHPALGGEDLTETAQAPSAAVPRGDAYATRHDPFVYFHSITDSRGCATRVVALSRLTADLRSAASTPNLVFITPNLCNDGHDGAGTGAAGTTCANGDPGGLTSIDRFLHQWVPQILASPAYRRDGLLIITFDESSYAQSERIDPASGHKTVDFTFEGASCCGQEPGPNIHGDRPRVFTLLDSAKLTERMVIQGFGGDRIGALLLSPFIKPGSRSDVPYNHYSLLRSLEDIFQLHGYLGYAGQPGLATIGRDRHLFTAPATPGPLMSPAASVPAGAEQHRPESAQARLGKALFFDASLSGSGRLSCAGCHSPAHAYGPPNGLAVQLGGPKLDLQGTRAVPSLRYVLNRTPIWSKPYVASAAERLMDGSEPPSGGFGWDGRFDSLQDQAAFALLAPNEMAGGSPARIAARLQGGPNAEEFRQVFGARVFDDPARAFALARLALQRFELEDPSFHPYSSKFDAWLDGRVPLTAREQRGKALFDDPDGGNCAACHLDRVGADGSHPLFTDYQFETLGVPRNGQIKANADPRYFDLGLCGPVRTDQSGRRSYCGLFETPGLRNVAARTVFFHNGRFHSLKQALRFYVQRDTDPQRWYPTDGNGHVEKFDDLDAASRANADTIDAPLTRKAGEKPVWNDAQIDDVIAFLQTLSDRDVQVATR